MLNGAPTQTRWAAALRADRLKEIRKPGIRDWQNKINGAPHLSAKKAQLVALLNGVIGPANAGMHQGKTDYDLNKLIQDLTALKAS